MNKYIGHFRTILKHKIIVGNLCCKMGFWWRGINHDNSKFGFTEFLGTAKYFQGDRSPIEAEKIELGYSLAWQHHKGRNPHHWEYWVDNIGTDHVNAIKVPFPYVVEMLCDFIGAGIVYNKKKWTTSSPLNYFTKFINFRIYHPTTKYYLEILLNFLKDKGLEYLCDFVRINKKYLRNCYEKDEMITL